MMSCLGFAAGELQKREDLSLRDLRQFSRAAMLAGLTLSLGMAAALSTTPADAQQYRLYNTKIVVHNAGDAQPQESNEQPPDSENSGPATGSADLQVISGPSQATGTITVTVPGYVDGKNTQFPIDVKFDAKFDLRGEAATPNIAIGANALGRPAHEGRGDPGPWLEPGSYNLSLVLPVQTSFGDEFIGTIAAEGTTTQRTINVKCHMAIYGQASNCELTFYYLEEE
jgi:hypothetical protein